MRDTERPAPDGRYMAQGVSADHACRAHDYKLLLARRPDLIKRCL